MATPGSGDQQAPGNVTEVLPSGNEPPQGVSDGIKNIAGLIAVAIGVLAVTGIAIATMAFVDSKGDATTLIPFATAAFGVISAVVGAYLGIKLGTDQSKALAQDATNAHAQLAQAHENHIADLKAQLPPI